MQREQKRESENKCFIFLLYVYFIYVSFIKCTNKNGNQSKARKKYLLNEFIGKGKLSMAVVVVVAVELFSVLQMEKPLLIIISFGHHVP